MGPWPAGCKAHSRAVAYAGSHNPSRGEGCPEGERGESKHPSHPLAQRSDPGGMHLAKGIRPAPRDHPLCGKPPSDAASLPRFPTLRIFFFCNFLRDFRLIFRWKAVVDSVQFRVILNITTKRFDAASWHAEMLRFGRRPTAADATARNDPSREKATLENPQIFQSCKSKNFISAAIARAKRRQFQIVHPTNERSLTYLESTTP